jgi:hypothetical protein
MDGNLVTGARLRLESDMTWARSEVQHDRTLAVEELGRKLVGRKFFARERTGVLDCGHSRSRRYALASHLEQSLPPSLRAPEAPKLLRAPAPPHHFNSAATMPYRWTSESSSGTILVRLLSPMALRKQDITVQVSQTCFGNPAK